MVRAVMALRRMRGGCQSQLMLCADDRLWIVKFRNNPQHLRVLANELIATRLAEVIGLSVPETGVIEVPEQLICDDPSMVIELPRGAKEPYLSGLNFGSVFAGGLMPGQVVDFLVDDRLRELRNCTEFAGMLAVDKWTANCDGRQAVFQRGSRGQRYQAIFIDQGFCFNGGEWNFPDSPLRGVYARNTVYEQVKEWNSFEPWLSRIETIKVEQLIRIAEEVPPLWYGSDPTVIRTLMDQLFMRRTRVRELILAFRDSYRQPFPLWK